MKAISLKPFDLPEVFRNYLYNNVVLKWEIGVISIIPETFSKKSLHTSVGIRVELVRKLSEVERRYSSPWGADEFIVFYVEGKGYESLFKRLRDTFAHGHYGSDKRGWITICHRYKGRSEKQENARLYGRLKQSSLKQLISYIDQSDFGAQ
jgi:hypothetical protein